MSPDGRYLAASAVWVQIYIIGSDATLTAVLPQPFTVTLNAQGDRTAVSDMTWDQSSAFLLISTASSSYDPRFVDGGVGVLSLSGNTLTETVYPTGSFGNGTGRILRVGSRVYAMGGCFLQCVAHGNPSSVVGLDFQNGQLIPLTGSPYPYGNTGHMVIY